MKQSIKNTDVTFTGSTYGSRTLENFALDGEILKHGWMDENNYERLPGLKGSLVSENPNSDYMVQIGIVPHSADDKWLEAQVNNIRTSGSVDHAVVVKDNINNAIYSSDEAYIFSAPPTVYQKSPAGKIYTIVLINAIVKNPS